MSPVSDIDSAIEAIGQLAEAARKAGQFELNDRVLKVQQTLMRLLQENLSLVSTNAQLKDKLAQLEAASVDDRELVYRDNAYWRVQGDDRDGPFCSVCRDTDGKLIRLKVLQNGMGLCGKCKNASKVAESLATPEPRTFRRARWLDEPF